MSMQRKIKIYVLFLHVSGSGSFVIDLTNTNLSNYYQSPTILVSLEGKSITFSRVLAWLGYMVSTLLEEDLEVFEDTTDRSWSTPDGMARIVLGVWLVSLSIFPPTNLNLYN